MLLSPLFPWNHFGEEEDIAQLFHVSLDAMHSFKRNNSFFSTLTLGLEREIFREFAA